FHDSRRSLVNTSYYMQIIEGGFACTATAASCHAAGLVCTPGKGNDISPVLMVGILGFAIGTFDFHEHINRHCFLPVLKKSGVLAAYITTQPSFSFNEGSLDTKRRDTVSPSSW